MSTKSTQIWLLRHGVTEWNQLKRIQGRRDIALLPASRCVLAARQLPRDTCGCNLVSSPLSRAMDTARLIGGIEPTVEHRLIEMDWGDWEGCSLPELRERLGRSMQENESRGLDFTTPAGDSPRAVMSRFIDWAGAVARLGESVVAVTHKGVIRAALAYAIGWNMEHKAPVKLDWDRIHGFEIDREGQFALVLPNVALDARPQGGSERER